MLLDCRNLITILYESTVLVESLTQLIELIQEKFSFFVISLICAQKDAKSLTVWIKIGGGGLVSVLFKSLSKSKSILEFSWARSVVSLVTFDVSGENRFLNT